MQPESGAVPEQTRVEGTAAPSAERNDLGIGPTAASDTSLSGDAIGLRPTLSLAEFRACPNLAAIRVRYESAGLVFRDEASLLERVATDWRLLRNNLLIASQSTPLPSEFPVEKVVLNGRNCSLVGILHSISAHPDATILMRKFLAQHPFPLTEQNLGILNYGLHSGGLDIPDQHAQGVWATVIANEIHTLRTWRLAAKRMFSSLTTSTAEGASAPGPETEEGKGLGNLQRALGVRNELVGSFSRALLFTPPDLMFEQLPTAVSLELKEKRGERLGRSVIRSAYMAEFLRNYNPELALREMKGALPAELFAKASSEIVFLCGAAHVEEIKYFLAHGVRDANIRELAQRDANLLNTDVPAFIDSVVRRERSIQALGYGLAIAKGVGLAAAITGAIRLFS